MSQTIVPAAPAGGPSADALDGPAGAQPGAGTLRDRVGSAWAALRHSLSDSPGRLRLVSGIAILAAVVIALGGGAALRERSSAIDEAAAASSHLILLQGIQTELVQANADATNSFLGFGLEPQPQRLDYIASIQQASRDLTTAAQASPAEASALGTVNAELTRYTGYVSSSRANNLFGNPVGADYLNTASAVMNDPKTGIIPQLGQLTQADGARINSAYSRSGHAALWLGLVVILGVGGLIGTQVYLTRHSRRILNLPLAAATVGVIVALIVAGSAMAVSQSKANSVRHGALAQAETLSNSRVAAFGAKSSESLTLIAQGSATAADTDWVALMKTATADLPAGVTAARNALTGYTKAHVAINQTNLAGNWRAAVTEGIALGPQTANGQFAIYNNQTASALKTQASTTASGLSSAGDALLPAGILVLLIGLLAAVGAWWGVTLRLDEYR